MKPNYKLYKLSKAIAIIAIIIFTSIFGMIIQGRAEDIKNTSYNVTAEDIIASAHASHLEGFEDMADKFRSEHDRLGEELLSIFKDTKSSNLNQCAAAYYLGELRIPEATDLLADNITLSFDMSHTPLIKHLIRIDISGHPVVDALIKIGTPSIPAVIRNLAESDDAQVRKLSLQVLCRIDGDKDITQLRLQKALKAEKDSKEQARLQSALKVLLDQKFNK